MPAPNLLGLPPITPELKTISPYLQRADELSKTEPVISYWCAYYAAQVGISLKAKDAASRNILFELLGLLEQIKSEIGPNDAIDIESASAAYVENFALKVFGMADDEDRRGQATRSTAKKYLAAANFLEVLKIFPQIDVAEPTEEKIRYAKWRAADIAKAFREGRSPIAPQQKGDVAPSITSNGTSSTLPTVPDTAMSSSPPRISPPSSRNQSPPHITRANHPSHLDDLPQTPPRQTSLGANLNPMWGGRGESTPGSWSTTATPGTASAQDSGNPLSAAGAEFGSLTSWDQDSPTAAKGKGRKQRSGSGSSSGTASDNTTGNGKKSVHFTPSVVGGLSSTTGSPVSPSDSFFQPSEPIHRYLNPSGPQYPDISLYPSAPPSDLSHNPHDIPSLPLGFQAQHFTPDPQFQSRLPVISAPPNQPPQVPQYLAPTAPAVTQEIVLTPALVAKAQKHCRFAISSLDYDDLEQARKELRAALGVLGG